MDKIKQAAERGVKVVVLRGQPETAGLEKENERFFTMLENTDNITILTSPRIFHTKLIRVDGLHSIIGSANLSRVSLFFNEESSYMVSGDCPIQRQIHEQLKAAIKVARSR